MMSKFTQILEPVEEDDRKTSEQLLALVYHELRRLAAWKMARENPEQTLQPTALVHEAFLRLMERDTLRWNSRKHFFNAAAEAMRRILFERARRKGRLKRGGGQEKIPLEKLEVATEADSQTLLLVEEALASLAAVDPFKAELVRLRFFAGLGNAELARVMGISEPTVKRHWAYARAWLYQEILELQKL
jgi:RNA polymerase sigma factor (TIGR02999 family)